MNEQQIMEVDLPLPSVPASLKSVTYVNSESLKADGRIFAAFTCSVCKTLFSRPLTLPGCGHSFCAKCLLSTEPHLRRKTIACPECHVSSSLEDDIHEFSAFTLEGLRINFSVNSILDAIRKEKEVVENAVLEESCPHIPLMSKSSQLCQHCQRSFCNYCQVSHIEFLKLETNLMLSGLHDRRLKKPAQDSIETKKVRVRQHISSLVERAEKTITQHASSLIEALTVKINENRDRLLSEVRQLGVAHTAKLEDVTSPLDVSDELEKSFKTRVDQLNKSSILSVSLQDVSKLRQEIFEHDSKVWKLERFEPMYLRTKVRVNLAPVDEFVESVTKLLKPATVAIDDSEYYSKLHRKNRQEQSRQKLIIPSDIKILHTAAGVGDIARLKEILGREDLSQSCKIFATSYKDPVRRQTALTAAAGSGSLEAVQLLIEAGGDVYIRDSTGRQPIHEAISKNHVAVVRYFLQHAPNLMENTRLGPGFTLLHEAASCGSFDVVKFFVEEKNLDIHVTDKFGRTPLHLSIEIGSKYIKVFKYLLEKGSKIDLKLNDGDYAIHRAADSGCLEIFRTLLELKPDFLDMRGGQERTPLLVVADGDCSITPKDRGKYCITDEDLKDEGPTDDIGEENRVEDRIYTVEMLKYYYASVEIAKILLEKGADVHVLGEERNTALHLAARAGNIDLIRMLLAKAPDLLEKPNEHDETALHMATSCEVYSADAVRLLVEEYNANVNAVSSFGSTPLLQIAHKGDLACFKLCLDRGANIKHADDSGYTVLHNAIASENLEMINFILDKNPALLRESCDDGMPLQYALSLKFPKVVELLLNRGASPDDVDPSGEDDDDDDSQSSGSDDSDHHHHHHHHHIHHMHLHEHEHENNHEHEPNHENDHEHNQGHDHDHEPEHEDQQMSSN